MPTDVEKRLDLLPKMSKQELLALWTEVFKQPPRAQLRRDLLIRILAYKLQEREYGGLSLATRQHLRQIARTFDGKVRSAIAATAPRAKTGTRLLREWKGNAHNVIILENGYEYAGEQYKSLSRIARLITGTSWSGPLFFGLKDRPHKEHPSGR